MKELIVNADDFGMTEGVNRGILEAHRHGIVTSTTLLANGGAFASAVAASRENPRLGIGVHLNLSEGQPVAPPAGIPTLVDSHGRLHLTPGKLRMALLAGRVRSADIETELRAQVAKILDAKIVPTHLDGHMHVHVLRGVSEAVIKIAREFHILAVRCPIEPLSSLRAPSEEESNKGSRGVSEKKQANAPPSGQSHIALDREYSSESLTKRRFVSLAVSFNARRLRRLLQGAGLLSPAHFYGTFSTGYLDAPALSRILRGLPDANGVSELMCHPGYVDAALPREGGRLQSQREIERASLTSPETVRQAADERIHLITYRDLATPSSASGPAA